MLIHMATRAKAATVQRYLEAVRHYLPVNSANWMLEAFLDRWNPNTTEGTRKKDLSNLRTFCHPRVRAQWDKIMEEAMTSGAANINEAFRRIAVQVRNGRDL